MRKHNLRRVFYILFVSLFSIVAMGADLDKRRNRIEELFIWKVSDTLGLDSKQETEFSQIMSKLREDKSRIDDQISQTLRKLESEKDKKKIESHLKEYKKYLAEYSELQMSELDKLEKLFGAQKLATYLTLKEKLVSKLKDAMASAGKASQLKVKDPKVVHEE